MPETELDQEIPLEYNLFALAFKEPGAISKFSEELPPEMVGAIHGNTGLFEFYTTLLSFHEKTGLDPVDPIAFKAWLESDSDIQDALGGAGGVSVFMDLILSQPLSTPDSVVKILRHRANKRKQLDALQELQSILANKKIKSNQDVDKITTLTDEIRSLENDLDYDPLAGVTTATDIASRVNDLLEIPAFLPTPFKDLNIALGYLPDAGMARGCVYGVAAQSGFGKSTFTKTLCNHWADNGYTILFINFEEAQSHWERILFTQIIKENVYANAKSWTPQEAENNTAKFKDKLMQWGNKFMVKHDPDSLYFDDLEKWLRDIIGHNGIIPDVVVIDTIQSLLSKKGGPRWEGYESMMIRLEKLARDMNSVFILTAQQNTAQAKEKREVVEQYDIGGSISIIQKCSVVMVLTQKKMLDDASADEYLMEVQIPKNRITGSTFSYDPPLVRYNDETKSYEEYEMVDDKFYDQELVAANVFGDDFHK